MKKRKMGLLDLVYRNRMPHEGDEVEIYQRHQLLAAGTVISLDHKTVTIADRSGLIDLDTDELRRGLNDGSIHIRPLVPEE